MKKLISLVCTASIMASILAPVASAINLSNEAQTVRYSTEIAGKQDVEICIKCYRKYKVGYKYL